MGEERWAREDAEPRRKRRRRPSGSVMRPLWRRPSWHVSWSSVQYVARARAAAGPRSRFALRRACAAMLNGRCWLGRRCRRGCHLTRRWRSAASRTRAARRQRRCAGPRYRASPSNAIACRVRPRTGCDAQARRAGRRARAGVHGRSRGPRVGSTAAASVAQVARARIVRVVGRVREKLIEGVARPSSE
jgi:hypothetical protein